MDDKLDRMMEHYSEALDELMGAQTYAKRAHHAESADIRAKYLQMAKQELEHADNLKTMAFAETKDNPMLGKVWGKLREHLDSWRDDIMEKMQKTERR